MLLQNLIVGRAGNLSRFARHWQLRPVVHVGVFLPSARAMAETDDTPPVGYVLRPRRSCIRCTIYPQLMLCRNRRFRVYTRTGDKGQSSLYNGERRNKDDAVFEALGDVDELNAHVGVAREHVAASNMGFEDQLVWIQSRLLDVGSAIATPPDRARPEVLAKVAFPIIHSEQLEHWIDAMDDQLPQLTNFILPVSGCAPKSARMHTDHS